MRLKFLKNVFPVLLFLFSFLVLANTASAQSYRYIQWDVTQRKCADNSIQASEFVLLQNSTPIAWPAGSVATNPGGSNPGGETPPNMIDGNTGTKWLDFNFDSNGGDPLLGSSKLVVDTGAGNFVAPNGYRFATANDSPCRDPIGWSLYGSNDGVAYTLLDSQSNQPITDSRFTFTPDYNFSPPPPPPPSGSANLVGYAWSSNIGWISFSSVDTGSAVSYGVDLGVLSGGYKNLTGYAWAPNIGWIQFGGLSNFPSGSGTVSANARLNGSNLEGWARAFEPNASGVSGWDGWISLRGTLHGISLVGNDLNGFAWGSSVVGWMNWGPMPNCGSGCSVRVNNLASATFGASIAGSSVIGTTVAWNSNVSIDYTLINFVSGDTCSVTQNGSPFVSGLSTTGSTNTGGLSTGSYTFAHTCTNGLSGSMSFNVAAEPPGISIDTPTSTGGVDIIKVKFKSIIGADSEVKTINVYSIGGFSGNVSIDVGTISGDLDGSTIIHSLNSGGFVTDPVAVVVNCPTTGFCGSITYQINVSKRIRTKPVITMTANGTGVSDTLQLIVNPAFNPSFEEF